ncbi:MAG: NYN domain-containing protein [Rhodobacterales bacterium]|nr:NYN domain-containing protein [Rhodobacterales bacterium]
MAVLVDGENMGPGLAADILDAAGPWKYQVVRRVYGAVGCLNRWRKKPGFELIHSQSAKNAADIRMVIDAMRLSYEGRADQFVIASSDSDFTQLAHHLRERGHEVVAVVGKAAGEAFRLSATVVVEVSLPEVPVPFAAPVQVAVTKPVQPKPVPAANAALHFDITRVNDQISSIFKKRDKGNGILLRELTKELADGKRCSLGTLGVASWASFLRSNPQLYECDPKGQQARVRLVGAKPREV